MMAVQYIDFPADNHQLDFRSMLAWLRTRRLRCLGFGGVTYLALAGARPERPVHARRRGRGDALLGA